MKHLAWGLSLTLAVAVAVFPASAQSTSAPPKATQTSEVVIKGFYQWYIRSISQNIDPFKKGRATLRKYVTLRLIREVEKTERDADYFLQTQEWDDEWEESVSVSQPEVRGTTATAIVTFNAEGYPRVNVSLKQEGGIWKLDQVRKAPSGASLRSVLNRTRKKPTSYPQRRMHGSQLRRSAPPIERVVNISSTIPFQKLGAIPATMTLK